MGKGQGKKILLIEHDPAQTRLIRSMFNDQVLKAFELTCVECMSKAEQYLTGHSIDIVLLDLGLPDPRGLEALRRIRAKVPRISVVLMSRLEDEQMAVQGMQEGANDYFIKGHTEPLKLIGVLSNAVEPRLTEEVLFNDRKSAQTTFAHDADAQIFTGLGGISYFSIPSRKG
jgi:DNA-binding NtrC family response regulator